MNIEVKSSKKLVDYNESMRLLEKRVENVFLGKEKELLWILEHNTVYTAGSSAENKDIVNKKIKIIELIEVVNILCILRGKKLFTLY